MTLLGNKPDGEITLRGTTLWGRDVLPRILMITPLGIPLDKLLRGLMNSAGDRKNFVEDDLSVVIS